MFFKKNMASDIDRQNSSRRINGGYVFRKVDCCQVEKKKKSCRFFGIDSKKVADFLEFYYLCGQIKRFDYDTAQVRKYSNRGP